MVVYCNNQAVITSHYSPTSPEQQPSSRMAQAGGGGTSVAVTYTSASPLDRQSGIQSKLKITISPHGRTPNFNRFLSTLKTVWCIWWKVECIHLLLLPWSVAPHLATRLFTCTLILRLRRPSAHWLPSVQRRSSWYHRSARNVKECAINWRRAGDNCCRYVNTLSESRKRLKTKTDSYDRPFNHQRSEDYHQLSLFYIYWLLIDCFIKNAADGGFGASSNRGA